MPSLNENYARFVFLSFFIYLFNFFFSFFFFLSFSHFCRSLIVFEHVGVDNLGVCERARFQRRIL